MSINSASESTFTQDEAPFCRAMSGSVPQSINPAGVPPSLKHVSVTGMRLVSRAASLVR